MLSPSAREALYAEPKLSINFYLPEIFYISALSLQQVTTTTSPPKTKLYSNIYFFIDC